MNCIRLLTIKAPNIRHYTLMSLFLLLTSCSTMTKSILLGTGIGTTTGALIGSQSAQGGDHEEKNRAALTGAAIGAGLGALISYSAHKQKEKKLPPVTEIKGFGKDPKVPAVTMPEVRRIWVPDKIDGNKYETGHWIYILEKTSNWSQP